jgi:hypothetical protein
MNIQGLRRPALPIPFLDGLTASSLKLLNSRPNLHLREITSGFMKHPTWCPSNRQQLIGKFLAEKQLWASRRADQKAELGF